MSTLQLSDDITPEGKLHSIGRSIGSVRSSFIAIYTTLFLAVFANPIDLEATQPTTDIQIGFNYAALVKATFVASAGILGAWGLVRFSQPRRVFNSIAGVVTIAFGSLYIFSRFRSQ